jgi:hypothetical protein
MKSKLLFPVIIVAGLMAANFSINHVYGQPSQNEQVKQLTVMYTCSLHPEVVQDKPGKCPRCGMTLVEKKDMQKGDIHQAHDSACTKKEPMKMMSDSTCIKQEHLKMMPDSTMVKKESMMQNTEFMNHEDKDM